MAEFVFLAFFRDQELQPGGWSWASGRAGGRGSGWGDSVEERDNAMEYMSGVLELAGDCNGLGGGRSGRGRLDVGTRLKGEAMTGNGLGGE